MVVRGREFIVDTIVFGRDRDGRVGLVERVHDLLPQYLTSRGRDREVKRPGVAGFETARGRRRRAVWCDARAAATG